MAIDTRFLSSAKDKAAAIRRAGMQFVRENPHLNMGSAAAMLIAPAVFKNDNRGYMQTAAVTTPLIAAATYAAPSILSPFRSQFSSHRKPGIQDIKETWKASGQARAVSYGDMRKATQDYAEGSVPLNVYQDVQRRYYSGRMRKDPNLVPSPPRT